MTYQREPISNPIVAAAQRRNVDRIGRAGVIRQCAGMVSIICGKDPRAIETLCAEIAEAARKGET